MMNGEGLDVFDLFSESYTKVKQETMSLRDYLLGCRDAVSYTHLTLPTKRIV